MAVDNKEGTISLTAGGTISQYHLVKLSTDDFTVLAVAAATDNSFGVALDDATTASPYVSVQYRDIAKVKAGGTIAVDDYLIANTDAEVVASTATDNARIVGRALEGGSDGDIISVQLQVGYHPANL